MGVKDLQQLDVRGDHRDQITLVPAVQLGGGQAAQRAENLVPDEGQQLEGDVVVAGLLGIAQHAAGQSKHAHAGEQHAQSGQTRAAQRLHDGEAAEDGNELGAQKARHAHGDGKGHEAHQRLDQPHEPEHYRQIRTFFHARASCWVSGV